MEYTVHLCFLPTNPQDSLRTLVLSSLKSFVTMMESAAHFTLQLAPDFTWTHPLAESPFRCRRTVYENVSSWYLTLHDYRPLQGPLFFLDLVLDSEGSHYSQPLTSFQPTLIAIFDRGISSTHSVPMVEKVCNLWIVLRILWISYIIVINP